MVMFWVTILAISGVAAVVQEATSPIAYASRHQLTGSGAVCRRKDFPSTKPGLSRMQRDKATPHN